VSTELSDEWVPVDVIASNGGAFWCQGCYCLEVEAHFTAEWEKPHGPDCLCGTPVWMRREDAVRLGWTEDAPTEEP